MLDLIVLHRPVLGNDFSQQQTKPWNVPLTVAQLVKELALSVIGTNGER